MPNPSLGTNLSSIVDWTTAFPFVDLFKTSRPWFTQRDGAFDTGHAEMLDLDAAGWVKGFTENDAAAPFQRVCTILNTANVPLRPGIHILEWTGQGQVDVAGVRVLSREAGRITVELGQGSVGINILSTDPNNNGNYIRDMKFYHADDADLMAAGVTFNPDFLERIEDFRVLRFMDWMGTNNVIDPGTVEDMLRDNAARHSVSEATSGASLEVMIELANETRADPWFTIPYGASAEWIRAFATEVRDTLDAGLVARFEYSNEVWNWGFRQAHTANTDARAAWGEVEGGWMQHYGVVAAEMAHIVADVFGSETGTRALNVFSTQSGWLGVEKYALEAKAHVARGGEAPADAPFHVYAIAPYFSGGIGSEDMEGRVNTWISQGEAGFRAALNYIANGPAQDSLANIGTVMRYHAGVAESLGWQLEAYEGGQHVVDQAGLFNGGAENKARTAFFTALVERPEFGDFYTTYLETWKDSGGGLMAQFSDFSSPSRYGSWGIWESPWSSQTSRGAAVEAFRDGTAAWWGDNRPASTFEGRHTVADRDGDGKVEGAAGADRLFGLLGDDVLNGRAGSDDLYGGAGADRLTGGAGRDLLSGGRDGTRDVFIFSTPSETKVGVDRDIILDFERGIDDIDLRGIDANASLAGYQALHFAAGPDAGSVWMASNGSTVLLRGDVSGNTIADFEIQINGTGKLVANDLLLDGLNSAPTIPPPPPTGGTGPDTITVKVSGDAYKGDPNFALTINGRVVDSTNLVTADHSEGEWDTFVFKSEFNLDGTDRVGVSFTNDAWGGSSSTDRNLYVDEVSLNDEVNTTNWNFRHNGTQYWDFLETPVEIEDTVSVRVSGDAWKGDPAFKLTLNGATVAASTTVTADHANGEWQTVTFKGDFNLDGSDRVGVSFTNDAWGGTSSTDRNLYVDEVSLNDEVNTTNWSFMRNGTQYWDI